MKNVLIFLLLPLAIALSSAGDPKTAEEFYEQGMEHYYKQDFKKAIEAFSEAIKLKPDFAEAYLRRGVTYDDMGDPASSCKDYTRSIELSPSAVAYNNRGIVKAIAGEYKCAVKDYNKALKLKHDYGVALMNRGFAYHEMGEKEKACKDWTEAGEKGIGSAAEIVKEYCK